MKKSEFEYEEDYIISCECEECGCIHMEEVEECENCGCEDLTNETSHESCQCAICGNYFDMWEDGYGNNNDELICESCYDELEE